MGTSLTLRILQASRQDHPHAYGDKIITARIPAGIIGSSPRVWGQVYTFHNNSYLAEDHPHAYGDKITVLKYLANVTGSSPRVWGQGYKNLRNVRRPGIIPTRMGTRMFSKAVTSVSQDHPHAYGDKFVNIWAFCNILGSSPRVWGQAYAVTF